MRLSGIKVLDDDAGAVLNRTQRPLSETVAGKGLCEELETLERKKA